MAGGALMVSRYVNLHAHIKKRLEVLGFKNVSITSMEKDALNSVINDLKPDLLLIACGFYECVTPYMTGRLLRLFPDLNVAAVSVSAYPADLAMRFIVNGANSCIQYHDGIDQFYRGLDRVKDGEKFISASVLERIELRREMPEPARELTGRQIEVIRLLCNGFTSLEAGDALHISESTVNNHKAEIYLNLGVRNVAELIRAALYLEIIDKNELVFYGGNYELKPKTEKNEQRRFYDYQG